MIIRKIRALLRLVRFLLYQASSRRRSIQIVVEANAGKTEEKIDLDTEVENIEAKTRENPNPDVATSLALDLVDKITNSDIVDSVGLSQERQWRNVRLDLYRNELRRLNGRLVEVARSIKNFRLPVIQPSQTDKLLDETIKLATVAGKDVIKLKGIDVKTEQTSKGQLETLFERLNLRRLFEERQVQTYKELKDLLKKSEKCIYNKDFSGARKNLLEADRIGRFTKDKHYKTNIKKLNDKLGVAEQKEKQRIHKENLRKIEEQLELQKQKEREEQEIAKKLKEQEELRKAEEEQREKALRDTQRKLKTIQERKREEALQRQKLALEQAKPVTYVQKIEVRENAEEQRKKALQNLLVKKPDWESYRDVLQANKILYLYHFTDRSNIASIKSNDGLYSWQYCERNSLNVTKPGGSPLSRSLDSRYGLADYVRLSFAKEHPMRYVAINDGRITNPVVLQISTEVCHFGETMFSNMNATKNGCQYGKGIDDLGRVQFDIVKKSKHFDVEEEKRHFYQAEVMVRTWLPAKYILNLNEY